MTIPTTPRAAYIVREMSSCERARASRARTANVRMHWLPTAHFLHLRCPFLAPKVPPPPDHPRLLSDVCCVGSRLFSGFRKTRTVPQRAKFVLSAWYEYVPRVVLILVFVDSLWALARPGSPVFTKETLSAVTPLCKLGLSNYALGLAKCNCKPCCKGGLEQGGLACWLKPQSPASHS